MTNEKNNFYVILGVIFAIISVFFCPPGFGIAGIVMGAIATAKGNKGAGIAVMVGSVIAIFIGMALGASMAASFIG